MMEDVTRHVDLGPYDVCVVGGGCAGLCAALASARTGAHTILVTDRPVLGGNSSSELRVPPAGTGYYNPWGSETGIIHELIMADRAANHDIVEYGHANGVWDFTLYDACRRELKLEVQMNCCINQVRVDDGILEAVSGVQSGSGSTLRISADMFIDASGDGCVGIGAGVPWRQGREGMAEYDESLAPPQPDDFVLGNTLTFRARDVGYPVEYAPPDWAAVYHYPEGIPYRSTRRFAGGYWWIEIGWPLDPLHDTEASRDELLRHVYGVWDHIKNRGQEREAARGWVLDWVGMFPARRESRRFVGSYVLTQNDIQSGKRFPDTIGYGGWSIDDHTRGGILAVDQKPSFDGVRQIDYFVTPYPVPLRTLFSDEVDNLLFAGRVMSASRVVFTSLRVQQTLAALGQAAGTAAALCATTGQRPRDLVARPETLQQRLVRDDCYLPGVSCRDLVTESGGVARASSVAPFRHEVGSGGLAASSRPAALLPLTADRLEAVSLHLRRDTDAKLRLLLYPAEHVWDIDALRGEPIHTAELAAPAGEGWLEASVGADVEPNRYYWLRLTPVDDAAAGVVWSYASNDPVGSVCASTRPDGATWFSPSTWSKWWPLAINVTPESRPYTADQAICGSTRPDTWVHEWVSDPDQPLPQWIEIEFDEPVEFNAVNLVFDTNLNRPNIITPPFFKAPECVKDYTVAIERDGGWHDLIHVTDNHQRRREHPVVECAARRIRLTVNATHGDPSARVAAFRLYRD